MKGLSIGQLAKQTGLSAETIRFYERHGLITPPPRTDSNYRVYPEEEIPRLRFIKRAKALGFTLNEIKELIDIRHDPKATKADIKKRTEEKIAGIKEKVRDIENILKALEHLSSACDGHGPLDECPILEVLDAKDEGHCKH